MRRFPALLAMALVCAATTAAAQTEPPPAFLDRLMEGERAAYDAMPFSDRPHAERVLAAVADCRATTAGAAPAGGFIWAAPTRAGALTLRDMYLTEYEFFGADAMVAIADERGERSRVRIFADAAARRCLVRSVGPEDITAALEALLTRDGWTRASQTSGPDPKASYYTLTETVWRDASGREVRAKGRASNRLFRQEIQFSP